MIIKSQVQFVIRLYFRKIRTENWVSPVHFFWYTQERHKEIMEKIPKTELKIQKKYCMKRDRAMRYCTKKYADSAKAGGGA